MRVWLAAGVVLSGVVIVSASSVALASWPTYGDRFQGIALHLYESAAPAAPQTLRSFIDLRDQAIAFS
jgi:hypothetical protein